MLALLENSSLFSFLFVSFTFLWKFMNENALAIKNNGTVQEN
jgi:hypothetical protein